MKTEIIYEDADILIIYKPAGLATQTAKVGQQDVVSELKNYLAKKNSDKKGKGQPYLGVIHRLDQPVEGLLVFAKTPAAAAALSKQLTNSGEEGLLNKQYYAVVCGQPEPLEGELVDKLLKTKEGTAVIANGNEKDAKKAVLHYRMMEKHLSEPVSLVDIQIETGRFHQIRVQMSHAGMPLLGDKKYGSEEEKALSDRLNIRTVALCAVSISLKHPVSGKRLDYTVKPKSKAFALFA